MFCSAGDAAAASREELGMSREGRLEEVCDDGAGAFANLAGPGFALKLNARVAAFAASGG